MRFLHGTNIDFVGIRTFFFILSVSIVVSGLISTFIVGIDYGIDFTGGFEKTLKFSTPIPTNEVRSFLNKSGIAIEEIKSYGTEDQLLIRLKDTVDFAAKFSEGKASFLPGNNVVILKEDTISAKIGKELRFNAFLAILLSIVAILIYIAFRFEFIYGVGAIVAMIHDVIFTFSIIVVVQRLGWMNLEVNQDILAAMLTVIGYSVNDTVIIFDRIRENKTKHKGMNFVKMINLSINETLSRTINTVLTVALVLLVMIFFAGPVLQGFAFTMLIGIIVGTYSSVYIASSYVIWHMENVRKVVFEDTPVKKSVITSKI
jgi:preprotein translocase subunit SecF